MIRAGLSILFITFAFAWAGQSDMEAQERAKAHKRETIAAAKAEYKRQQAEHDAKQAALQLWADEVWPVRVARK